MLSCAAPALTVVQHLDQQHHRHLAPHPGHLLVSLEATHCVSLA